MYWAVLFSVVSVVSSELHLPELEYCSHGSCNDVSRDSGIDDYTSVLQVSMSVDKTRGYRPPASESSMQEAIPTQAGVDSVTPNPEAPVEKATLDETMVVLGEAGDASIDMLRTTFHSNVQDLWKRLQMKPPHSTFDFAVGLFVLASMTTSFAACTLVAIRGKTSKGGRRSAFSRVFGCIKVKPETITRVSPPLPEFHPAKQTCAVGPPTFPRSTNGREAKHKELQATESGKQPQRATQPQTAEQILQEAERYAAQAAAASQTEGNVVLTEKMLCHRNKDALPLQWELKSLGDDSSSVDLEVLSN